jgi:predicted HNH restriction endonuclease
MIKPKRLRKPITPRSKIRAALRQVWLRSRERALALKIASYSCQTCGAKQSKAKGREQKVEVHHKEGIAQWARIIDAVYEGLLVSPDGLSVLCPKCHKKEHETK